MYKIYENVLKYVKKANLLIKFFLLFLLLIILPLIISNLINYKYSSNILEEEIHNSNKAMLKNTIKILDEKLSNLKESMLLFTLDQDLNKCANYTKPIDGTQHYEFSKIISKLKNLRAVKDSTENMFIYFFKSDYLISSEGRYSHEYFFNNTYKYKYYDAESWLNEFASIKGFRTIETRKVSNTVEGTSKNLINIYIPVLIHETPSAVFAASINENLVHQYLMNIDVPESGNIIVFNQKNEIISMLNQNHQKGLMENIMNVIKTDNARISHFTADGMIVTYSRSLLTGWYYATVIPRSGVLDRIKSIKTKTYIICSFFILLGLALALFLSKNMYKPIGKILNAVGGYSSSNGQDELQKESEYNYIYKKICNLKDDITYFNNFFKGNIKVLKSRLLYQILTGEKNDTALIKLQMQELKMDFTYCNYMVVMCKIDYYKRYFNEFSEKQRENIERNIFEYFQTCLSENASCFILNVQKDSAVFAVASDSEILKPQICKKLQYALDILRKDAVYARLCFGVGNVYKKIVNLKLSYNEALESINLRLFSKAHQIIDYSKAITNKFDVFRPDEQENVVVNNLLTGNCDNAISVINDMIDKNIQNSVPYKYLKSFLFEVATYYEKAAYRKGYLNVLCKEINIYDEIGILASSAEIKEYFGNIFSRLSEHISRERIYNNQQLMESVLDIINEKYGEDLYLGKIAEQFSISPHYLSRLFKDQMGLSFTKHLMQVRFSKANELLKNSSLKVADISKMVGYNNVNSFVRAFRQQEGVSPGSIRKNV